MPIQVNGVWRNYDQYVNLNGVQRHYENKVCINGVWRDATSIYSKIASSDISSFHMIYRKAINLRYNPFPWLRFNNAIENVTDVSGENCDEMNTNSKSFILRFMTGDYDTQGIYAYYGELYANIDGELISMSSVTSFLDEPDINVTIDYSTTYESNGPYVIGWNRFFSHIDNLPVKDHYRYEDKIVHGKVILPIEQRTSNFDTITLIGIAREMKNCIHNMTGSHGILSHNIDAIYVNGETKPFMIDIIK